MRRISYFHLPLITAVITLLLSYSLGAREPDGDKLRGARLDKTAVVDLETVDGNRIFDYINNRGAWCTHNNPIGFGMQWPGQSGHSVDFASGIWVAGLVNDKIQTAAAEYTYEYQPGNIRPDGTPDDPNDPRHQILKITKADLLDEGFSNPDYGAWINDLYQLGAPIKRDTNGQPILSPSGKRIPDMIGDQMLWMVYNDANPGNHTLFGTAPIGLEVQNTVWVFNRPDAFGDMMFMKFLLVNKGENTLKDAFIGLWFDIDLGDSNDDLVFCDSTLSLGAFWNDGDDTDFPVPPAVGADFFQGPIVPSPGDTANVSGRKLPGFKNLGMTSFAKYIRGGPPDVQDPENAQEAYNFMLGLNGLGQPIVDPTTNLPTKFVNVSDPETGAGWVDGQYVLQPADRRMLMNSGPFTLEPWVDSNGDGLPQVGEPGVQEVVAGFMIAQGTDAKNSATRLKQVDQLAQLAYDLNFALPPSPPNPEVSVHTLDREIVLTWGDEVESYVADDKVDVDEEGNPTQYLFQGYNIYQTDTPVIGPDSHVIKLATYDIADGVGDIKDFVFSEEFGEVVEATVQKAPDTGLQRYYRITNDALHGGVPLSDYNRYYFIVTAYGYNPHGIPKILESPLTVINENDQLQGIAPAPPPGGLKPRTTFGSMIAAVLPDTTFNAEHTSAGPLSNGQLEVTVVDPSQVTGMDYKVTFERDDETGEIVWNLDRLDPSGPTRLLSKQTNQSGNEEYTVVDGLLAKVIGAPNAFAFNADNEAAGIVEVAFGGVPLTPDQYDDAGAPFGGNTVWHSLNHSNETDRYYVSAGGGGGVLDRLTRYIDFAVPRDFELRFTEAGGYGVYAFTDDKICTVPFELWDIGVGTPDDPSDDRRMIPFLVEWDSTKAQWGWANGVDPAFELPASDWIYWLDGVDEHAYDNFAAQCEASGGPGATYNFEGNDYFVDFHGGFVYPIGRLIVCDFDGNGAPPPPGTTIRFVTTKPNSVNDVFTFSTQDYQAVATQTDAVAAAQLVNIFPNPYFGQNPAEIDPVNRFVTITHLPGSNVTIRVFTLAGDIIKTIDDGVRQQQGTLGTQIAYWDLRNDQDVPVASGMYLIHVDMKELGQKVLKAAIFMPEERLDKF